MSQELTQKRIVEVDILRTIAIIAIVFCHLPSSIPSWEVETNGLYEAIILGAKILGLSLFFFLSGYSLMIKKANFNNRGDLKKYFAKRVLRIYPLYWVALGALIITELLGFHLYLAPNFINANITQQLIIISGFQLFFIPQLFSNAYIYWFVSAILFLYLIFPILIFCGERIGKSFTHSIFLLALLIFIILVMISYFLVDMALYQIVTYYWFFISGIIVGKQTNLSTPNMPTVVKMMVLSGVGLIFIHIIQLKVFGLLDSFSGFTTDNLTLNIVNVIFVGAFGVSTAILFTNTFKSFLSDSFLRLICVISPSTFAIYLFHLYILAFVEVLAALFIPEYEPFIVIVFGLPLSILFPICIQRYVDRIVLFFTSKNEFLNKFYMIRKSQKQD